MRIGSFAPSRAALHRGDRRFVVAAIASRAGKLLCDPRELGGFAVCYPLRASSGDPVLAYDSGVVLSVWIAALAMLHGNLRTPLASLFVERLVPRRRWVDAAGLTLLIGSRRVDVVGEFEPAVVLARREVDVS